MSTYSLWLTAAQAAERASVNPRTIYDAFAKGHLVGYRDSTIARSRVRFHPDDVDRWVRGERPQPSQEESSKDGVR